MILGASAKDASFVYMDPKPSIALWPHHCLILLSPGLSQVVQTHELVAICLNQNTDFKNRKLENEMLVRWMLFNYRFQIDFLPECNGVLSKAVTCGVGACLH